MKMGLVASISLCLLALFTQGAFAQDSDRESFDRKMYTAVPLPHFGTSPRQFASLSVEQRRNLLACRDVLISLLQSVGSNSSISQYLAPDQAKKYRTPADLVAPETSLMEVGILDGDFEADGGPFSLFYSTIF
jgi:hypothetical protein